jgi:hypothetical protein
MLTWHEVEPTSIRAIGYDPDRCEVWVEYIDRSGPYIYFDVPVEVYAGPEQADRKGPYVNRVIKHTGTSTGDGGLTTERDRTATRVMSAAFEFRGEGSARAAGDGG